VSAPQARLWIDGGDVRLHGRELRSGREPALLLLHGYGDSLDIWRETVAHLPARQRSIALDLRGHGDSQWSPDGDYSLRAMVDDVRRVERALGLERFVVAGHSTGGMTALAFAAAEPTSVSAVALLDVDPFLFKDGLERLLPYAGPQCAATFDELVDLHAGGKTASRERVAARLQPLVRRGEDGRWTWKQDPRLRPATAVRPERPLDDASVARMLARVTCPLLLLYGEHSTAVSRDALARCAGLAGGAVTVRPMPAAGHALLTDAPEATASALSEWLATVA